MSFKGGIVFVILIIGVFFVGGIYFLDQLTPRQVEINLDTFDTQIEEELITIGAKVTFVKYARQGSIILFSWSDFIVKIKSGDEVHASLVFLPNEKNIKQIFRRYYSVKYDISYDEEIQNLPLGFKKHSFKLIGLDSDKGYLSIEETIDIKYLFPLGFGIIFLLIAIVVFFIPD